ncbi:hypothetical protein QE400_004246 [Xanthomonas sacchari]|uniref:hypothetical protein n=1 Tax=Xanthomonas sacchari TaxID=56458 RepID=UPI002784FA08|nr:hypothetical protein [Xanthomonas sacchari]MDQ1094833.1 hypothetical protein [Xanthomonas sacchari]
MRLLSLLWSCLLGLLGCQGHADLDLSVGASRETVVQASERGVPLLLSRTTYRRGLATFRCIDSRSGRCHYQVYADCAASPAARGGDGAACAPRLLQAFDLPVGQRREIAGLPRDFRQCVVSDASASACGRE